MKARKCKIVNNKKTMSCFINIHIFTYIRYLFSKEIQRTENANDTIKICNANSDENFHVSMKKV